MILFCSNDNNTVENLREKIGASKNTILSDLQEIKNWFEDAGIKLEAKSHKGYVVKGTEFQIRQNILKLLEINSDDNFYRTGYNLSAFWNLLLKQVDSKGVYAWIKEIVVDNEEKLQMFLDDYSFFEAVMELIIVINRVAQGLPLSDLPEDKAKELKSSSKYPFACNIFKDITKKYNLEMSENEILYYTECLRGKRYIKGEKHSSSTFDIRILIAEVVHKISSEFGIDYYLDFGLYDLMIAHMKSAVYRVKNGETLINPLKDSIKNDYPEILEIVKKHLVSLEEYIGKEFSEDEILFLVLYFAAVLEKEKADNKKNKKVPVALVCATGRGTAQFMMAKLKLLEDVIEVVSVSSYHNMKEIEKSGALMIISTIPISDTPIPYVIVRSPMLSKEDLTDIQNMAMVVASEEIDEKDNIKEMDSVTANIQGAFAKLLTQDRILLDYEAKDWEDAIRCAGRLLYQTGAVEKRYIEYMVENIKEHGPYIVVCKETALPHANTENGAIAEAASLVRLKKPIDFHSGTNDPVRYIIGMSIKSAQSINQSIYDMMTIFGTDDIRRNLEKVNSPEKVMEYINSLKK
jgi:transcriptional antiterminator/mannitol/fructose-specific phosphotransferase system IIA component